MKRRTLIAVALAAALVAAAVLVVRARTTAGAGAAKPRLALLTSLPLLFGEQFAVEPPRNAAIERLERRFQLVPIPVADRASLAGHSLLLMAHPRAQPAGALVELDQWVRRGGQVVVLADPVLRWQSERMPGDPLRPPPDFADTGLLAHWGLRLGVDEAGEGELRATGQDCRVSRTGLIAQCRVGQGSARIIADADFMMRDGPDDARRLDLLVGQLSRRDSR